MILSRFFLGVWAIPSTVTIPDALSLVISWTLMPLVDQHTYPRFLRRGRRKGITHVGLKLVD